MILQHKSASRTFEKSAGSPPELKIANKRQMNHSSQRKSYSPPPKTNMARAGKSTMNEVVFPIESGGGCSIAYVSVFFGGKNSK